MGVSSVFPSTISKADQVCFVGAGNITSGPSSLNTVPSTFVLLVFYQSLLACTPKYPSGKDWL